MDHAQPLTVVRGADQAVVLLKRTRRDLLAHLDVPHSAASLARKLGMPRQKVNYHLRQLEREGFLECVEERRVGNCTERLVRATARSFVISPEALGTLGTTPDVAKDRLSAGYLMSVAARTLREVACLEARAKHEGKRLATFSIDADVRFPTAAARAEFAQALAEEVARLASKYHDEDAPNGRTFRVVASIHPAATAHVETPLPEHAARPGSRNERSGPGLAPARRKKR